MTAVAKKTATDQIAEAIRGLPTFTASDLKNNFGKASLEALKNGVAILRHNTPQFVLLPVAQYAALQAARMAPLDALTEEFDLMVAKMQEAGAKRGVATLFDASPKELGRAAVKRAHGR